MKDWETNILSRLAILAAYKNIGSRFKKVKNKLKKKSKARKIAIAIQKKR